MPEILLTPELLESEAAKLLQIKDRLDQAFQVIASLIGNLVNGWHGQAQQAFVSSFENKKPTYTQFAQDMERFAEFMRTYAAHMQDADAGSAQRAAAL